MTTMKKFFSMFMLATAMLFAFTACKDDDNGDPVEPVADAPELNAVSSSYEQMPGETVNIQLNANAEAGIKSLAVSGDAEGNVDFAADDENQVVSYPFEVPADAEEDATFTLTFTLTDNADKTATANVTVTATATPVSIVEVESSAAGVGTTTWTANNIYVLNGFVYVNEGQTLTIEPGTVIKGQAGQAENASALIVARGGKLIANGEPDNPIIFTTLADDVSRTNDITPDVKGLWGGVILLGKAPINHANSETNIEGIPADIDPRSLYGGDDAEDSSGEMSYVSIRHGGTNIGAGNEINGLTMGGVGSGTVLHHIEVFGNDDDGFEWFGGTVNTSYLVSAYNQDDSYDMDFGWRGQNQFWLAYQEPGFENSNRGWESDGAHSGNLSASVFTQPQIYNMTMIGAGTDLDDNNAFFITEGFGAFLHNSIIANFSAGINLTDAGATGMNSRDRLAAGDLVFSNNIFYSIGNGTMETLSNNLPALATHLTTNNNEIGDPGISFDGILNPLPAAESLALTKELSNYPESEVNGFTYEEVDYVGAFGTENWLLGWTALDAYGLTE